MGVELPHELPPQNFSCSLNSTSVKGKLRLRVGNLNRMSEAGDKSRFLIPSPLTLVEKSSQTEE